MISDKNIKSLGASISEKDLNRLIEMIKTVGYGSVTLVIQDGKVIQIEKNEKIRLR
ncbi:MAG: YezD family protein [Bacillota bacterium]|nr:YezD family protein [Bacillota bacterium]